MNDLININFNYALVGASQDKEKYGYRVLKDLIDSGYTVFPINPKGGKILELKIFRNILEIEEKIDVIIFVVQPEIALKVLERVKERKIKKVWMQPGSESNEAEEFCKRNNIEYISKACIMIKKLI
jgi:uncharacterized protein